MTTVTKQRAIEDVMANASILNECRTNDCLELKIEEIELSLLQIKCRIQEEENDLSIMG
jgi:hypothetical protein